MAGQELHLLQWVDVPWTRAGLGPLGKSRGQVLSRGHAITHSTWLSCQETHFPQDLCDLGQARLVLQASVSP